MKVAVTQSINCAHQLPGTELHGHTYRITAIYSGSVGSEGIALELNVLDDDLARVLLGLNHLKLEDVIGSPATAERLAEYVKEAMMFHCQVRVQIGDDGYVETE